jgi:hypothetical protein
MAALIGALRVSLSADTAQFDAGMRKAQSTASSGAASIQKSLSGLNGFVKGLAASLSVGMFVNVIKNALEYAGSLAEVSQQIGVTSKDLQTLRFAAGQVGVSQEQLETGLSKLTITLGKVAAGAKAPTDALKAIGISAQELKGKDTGEAFRMIADALGKVTDRAQRAAVEVALFGKSGAALDNLLSGGSAALNQLTDAAEKLGIVLSDEQIAHADDTADKLEALKTVLSANIASVVADNSDAILTLANALASLVGSIGPAVSGWRTMIAEFKAGANELRSLPNPADLARALAGDPDAAMRLVHSVAAAPGNLAKYDAKGKRAQKDQALNNLMAPGWSWINGQRKPKMPAGADVGQFLAPKGPKAPKPKADHSAEYGLEEAHRFQQELDRANQDILQAQQSLATDYNDRAELSLKMIDAEQKSYDSDLDFQVQLNKLTDGKRGMTQVQADQLRAMNNQKVALDKQGVAQDVLAQRYEDKVKLEQADFDIQRDQLQAESQLADTASEARDVQLRLLDLAYRQEKARLQAVLADETASVAAKDEAQARLNGLGARYDAERKGVIRNTRNPLEQWMANVPQTADQITEAFQGIAAHGLDSISEAITGVITGTESLKQAFGSLAKSIIGDILQMTVKMLVFRAISGIIGGGSSIGGGSGMMNFGGSGSAIMNAPKFATGGGFNILGRGGTDRNVLSLNGLPIARVSHGERVNISNDNVNGGAAARVTIVPTPYFDAHVQGQAVQVAAPMAGQAAIAGASAGATAVYHRARRTLP